MGRIESAKSGAEARGSTDSLPNIPYRQTYAYDAFNHLTGRSSNHWIASYSISDTYTDDRNDNWTYDAAGNVLTATDQTNTLDAAEQVTKVEVTGDSRTMQDYDGVGQVVHQRAENWNAGTSSWYAISDKYLIRSSVLGGAVVTETNSDGYKVRTFVHAGGAVVAWQTDGTYMGELVNWMHQEPGGASSRSTDSTGAIVISGLYGAGAEPGELDPVGADSGLTNPYTDPDIPPDDGTGSSSQSSTAFGAPWHPRSTYSVDGIRVEPEIFFQVAAMSMQSPFNMLFYSIAVRRLDFFGHNTLTTWDPPAVDPNQLPPGGEEAGPNDIVNVNITLFRRYVNVNWVLTAFVSGQQDLRGFKMNDCQTFANIVGGLALHAHSDSEFVDLMKARFLSRNLEHPYSEFKSEGFKWGYRDDTPSVPGGQDNSPNQVYHFVGGFVSAYTPARVAAAASFVVSPLLQGAARKLATQAGIAAANNHEDVDENGNRLPDSPSHRADRLLNTRSVPASVDLAFGMMKRSELAARIRWEVCD